MRIALLSAACHEHQHGVLLHRIPASALPVPVPSPSGAAKRCTITLYCFVRLSAFLLLAQHGKRYLHEQGPTGKAG